MHHLHPSSHPPTAPSASQLHSLLSGRERTRRQHLRALVPGPYSALAARNPFNAGKNRYSDVLPYDRTRVKVDGGEGAEGYLNASWIEELDGKRRWIAAQAPTPSTMFTFFRYLLTSPSRALLQLTAPVESGVKKSDPYLPSLGKDSVFAPTEGEQPLVLRLVSDEWREAEKCTVTTVEVSLGSKRKTISQIYFAGWKDKGVPEGREGLETLLRLIKLVDKINTEDPSTSTLQDGLGPPIIVHCSAGVGRTGSFISLSSLSRLLRHRTFFPPSHPSPLGPLPQEIQGDPVARVIDGLREQRCMSVETREQVELVHEGRKVLEEHLELA